MVWDIALFAWSYDTVCLSQMIRSLPTERVSTVYRASTFCGTGSILQHEWQTFSETSLFQQGIGAALFFFLGCRCHESELLRRTASPFLPRFLLETYRCDVFNSVPVGDSDVSCVVPSIPKGPIHDVQWAPPGSRLLNASHIWITYGVVD